MEMLSNIIFSWDLVADSFRNMENSDDKKRKQHLTKVSKGGQSQTTANTLNHHRRATPLESAARQHLKWLPTPTQEPWRNSISGNCHRLNDPIWSKDHRRQTTETSQVSRHTHNTSQLQGTTKKNRERLPSPSKTLTQTFWRHTHTNTHTHTHRDTHLTVSTVNPHYNKVMLHVMYPSVTRKEMF